MEVEMTAVFGIVEHLARFGQHACGQTSRPIDRAALGEEINAVPVFPRFERLTIDLGGEPDTVSLFNVKANDPDRRSAREVGAIFP